MGRRHPAPEALNAEDPTGHCLDKRLGICCELTGKSKRKFRISIQDNLGNSTPVMQISEIRREPGKRRKGERR